MDLLSLLNLCTTRMSCYSTPPTATCLYFDWFRSKPDDDVLSCSCWAVIRIDNAKCSPILHCLYETLARSLAYFPASYYASSSTTSSSSSIFNFFCTAALPPPSTECVWFCRGRRRCQYRTRIYCNKCTSRRHGKYDYNLARSFFVPLFSSERPVGRSNILWCSSSLQKIIYWQCLAVAKIPRVCLSVRRSIDRYTCDPVVVVHDAWNVKRWIKVSKLKRIVNASTSFSSCSCSSSDGWIDRVNTYYLANGNVSKDIFLFAWNWMNSLGLFVFSPNSFIYDGRKCSPICRGEITDTDHETMIAYHVWQSARH